MDLKKIISQSESERLEFKESLKLRIKWGKAFQLFPTQKGEPSL